MNWLRSIERWFHKKEPLLVTDPDKEGLCVHLRHRSGYYGGHGRITHLGRVQNIVTAHCGECKRTWISCEDVREWTAMS